MRPKYIEDFLGDSRESGTQICYQLCPICNSDGWNVYIAQDTGLWLCFKCGAKGKVLTNHESIMPADAPGQMPALNDLPEIDLPPFRRSTQMSQECWDYLRSRGVSATDIYRYMLVEDLTGTAVIIPYYAPNGKQIYWSMRKFGQHKKETKYMGAPGKHPIFFFPGAAQEPTVIVEGAFDAMAVHSATELNVAALGGKTWARHLRRQLFDCCKSGRVLIMLDGDALSYSMKLAQELQPFVEVRVVPLQHGEDPASIGSEALKELLVWK